MALESNEVIKSLFKSDIFTDYKQHDLLVQLLLRKCPREREVMTTTRWRSEGKALQSRVTRLALCKPPKVYNKRQISHALFSDILFELSRWAGVG